MLSGLTRVRQFSQDDAHCFVREDQIGEEVEALLRLVQRVYGDFGLEYSAKLSTRPPEFLGEVATWDHAEAALKQALEQAGQALHDQRGRRRVLRPEDRLRRHRRDRAEVAVRHDPARLPAAAAVRPEVHRRRQRRAPAGGHPPGDLRQLRAVHRDAHRALRRRVPALARAGAGAACCRLRTGTWTTRARRSSALVAAGLRAELDERQEKIGYKIREAQLQKIPYMLVIGRPRGRRRHGGRAHARRRRSGRAGRSTSSSPRALRRGRARTRASRRRGHRRPVDRGRQAHNSEEAAIAFERSGPA